MKPLLALPVLILCSVVHADDWPQWRGRDRDGVAHNARLPAVLPATPPRPAWKQTVGEGQSSPVVAGTRLFILGRTGDEEGCYCMNARTGKMLWQTAYPCKFVPTDKSAGFGPKSTPTVDGDSVSMLGAAGNFGTHATLVVAGEVLLVLGREGELHVLQANPKKLVRLTRWQLPVTAPVWSHLAVAGSRLYVKDHTDVLCFDVLGR
jgi:outer membrane protein assembly factor BamB